MRYSIIRDIIIVGISIIIAILIVKTGLINIILFKYSIPPILLALLAGMFYASIFAAPLSIAAIITLAQDGFLIPTVIVGGVGAALGDLCILKFFKLGIAKDITRYFEKRKALTKHTARSTLVRIFFYVAGLVLIASPLPDEIGIFLLGTSKIKERSFVFAAYMLNAVGIYIIGMVALR